MAAPAGARMTRLGNMFALDVAGGPGRVARRTGDIRNRLRIEPDGTAAEAHAEAQRAVRPYVGALGSFAVLVALAGLVLTAQAVRRQARADLDHDRLLVAIGVTARQRRAALAVRTALAAAAGGLLAAVLAVAASGWAPVGPACRIEPDPGVTLDPAAVLAGTAIWVVVAVAAGVLAGWSVRRAPSVRAPRTGARWAGRCVPSPWPRCVGCGSRWPGGRRCRRAPPWPAWPRWP